MGMHILYLNIYIYILKNLIKILGSPKSSFGFFENLNKCFGQPSILEKAKLLRIFCWPLGESFLGTISILTLSHKEIIYTSKR